MKNFRLLIIFLYLLIPIVSASQNWKKIGQFDGKITSGYFFNNKSGVVSFVRGKSPVIARTTDGGVTWQESTLTGEISIFEGFLSCIHMRDSLLGYASSYALNFPSYYKDGVWFTLDGGKNWFSNKDSSQWVSLTTLPNGKLITSQGGIAFKDSLIGIQSIAAPAVSPYPYQSMYITNDGALTWRQIPNAPDQSSESWGLCYSTIFDAFYIASEMGSTVAYEINRTTNLGNTWDRISLLPVPVGSLGSTGDIQCYDSSIYIQTIGSGMYRSRDGGLTWKNVGGPSNDYDTRFCLPPSCKGNLVVAFSKEGEVWITENGGDGELNPTPQIEITPLQIFSSVSSCNTDTALVVLKYRGCGTISLDSINLSSDVSLFLLDTTNSISPFLEDFHTDTIVVIFIPNGNVGDYKIDIHIRARMGIAEFTKLVDTSISLSAKSTPVPPHLTISELQINLGSASTCNQARDTVITLRNTGCDTLYIIQGPGAIASEFTISALSYPYCLPPDSSVTINVRFTPSATGTFRAYPKYRAEQQGLSQDVELFLEGTGIEEGGELAYEPKSFAFPLTSICSQDSAFGFITNLGCDTLTLESSLLTGDIDFTSSTIGSNILVAPGDTLRYRILFMPSIKGTRSATLILSSKNNLPSRRDTISITATVTDGTRILASSPNTLDFGTTTLCEERDSVITLRNTGCDTLRLSGVGVQGLGFRVSGIGYTIIIPPGGSITIPVSTNVDTSQGNISTGTITFTSNADNQITPITLSRGYTYPKSYSLHLGMPQNSGTADDIVRLAVVGEKGLGSAGSGVNRIDFDLALNEDLLEYITFEGQNTVAKNGNHITITHRTELTSDTDTLAILRYHIFLTKDSATDITLSNLTLNNNDTSACAPTVAAQTSEAFTYRYECGDKSIQSFIRTGQVSLEIRSLVPNPTASDITIGIESSAEQTTTLEIYDMLGKRYYNKIVTLPKQTTNITIPTNTLPEGQYIIRIGAPTGNASRIFTKKVK